MPKLSIITINYNNLEGLKRTVESVLNQTWQEFEYIIIDGGSIDGSKAYLESQNDKIDCWVSERDLGIYNAMNKGIVKATGEYLLFLNSGDHFYSSKVLKKYYNLIGEYDLIYFNLKIIADKKEFINEYPDQLSFSYFVKYTLPHPSTFIKRNLFEKVGLYKEDFKIVSDWKFFIDSVCRYNSKYLHVDKILATFYLDGISSLPESLETIELEKQMVLKSDYPSYLQDLENVFKYMTVIRDLRRSRIIRSLIKLGFLNKF